MIDQNKNKLRTFEVKVRAFSQTRGRIQDVIGLEVVEAIKRFDATTILVQWDVNKWRIYYGVEEAREVK